jgi:hypothetical protein
MARLTRNKYLKNWIGRDITEAIKMVHQNKNAYLSASKVPKFQELLYSDIQIQSTLFQKSTECHFRTQIYTHLRNGTSACKIIAIEKQIF